MSAIYAPDESALPVPPWTTVHLADRDVASQVPINFVTHAGVSLTPACFWNGTYEDGSAAQCISNLLASQYRRLILDLYWDTRLRQFGFCPVSVPAASANTTSPRTEASSTASSATISSVLISRTSTSTGNGPRQATSLTSSPSLNASASSTVASSTQPPVSTATGASGETIIHMGSYQCTETLNLQFFLSLILNYVHNTSDTIQANLLYIDLNLHAAASAYAPDGPSQAPSAGDLPSPGELVGAQFSQVMSPYIFKPPDLESERSNLNESWYSVQFTRQPIAEYFTTDILPNGVHSTPDGWPCEAYVQITRANRVLIGWNVIDPQMKRYNFTGDDGIIFSPGLLSKPRLVTSSPSGQIDSGCFFDAAKTVVSQVDSSWALSSLEQVDSQAQVASNLTSCGISPVLNTTMSKSAADANAAPYHSLVESAVWSWAPGEPRNVSNPGVDDDNPKSGFRCAMMDITSAYLGRWRVDDCTNQYHVACRVNNEPHLWQLSSIAAPFTTAPDACPANTTFEVPRTGLEASYLYHQVLSNVQTLTSDDGGASGIWVNFNSLDVEGCWVTTGPNGTCSYYIDEQAIEQRTVLVPTIAAIIVLILTALTLFVKCNANRRMSRTRKRGEGGWDYEGVPS